MPEDNTTPARPSATMDPARLAELREGLDDNRATRPVPHDLDQREVGKLARMAGQMWMYDLIGVPYSTKSGWRVDVSSVDGRAATRVSFYPTGLVAHHRGLDTQRPTLLWRDTISGEFRCRYYTLTRSDDRYSAAADASYRVRDDDGRYDS